MRHAVVTWLVLAGCSASPDGRPCTDDASCGGDVCAVDDVCRPASEVRNVQLVYACPWNNCYGWLKFDEGDPSVGRPVSSLSLRGYYVHCSTAGVGGSATVSAVPVHFDWVVTMYTTYFA